MPAPGRWLGELAFFRAAGSQPAQQRDRDEYNTGAEAQTARLAPVETPATANAATWITSGKTDSASPDQSDPRPIGSYTTEGRGVA